MPLLSTTVALRIYYFVAFGAVGLYLPYFPTWLHERGFVGWKMSALAALLPFCQLLSPAVVGLLADRWGLRGRMMTLCAGVTAVGMSCVALSSQVFVPFPFVLAFACMFVFTALRSPTIGLADVLAMELAPNYGRMRLWGSLGFMVCSFLGGHLLDPTHPTALPRTLAVCVWVLVLVSLLLPQSSRLPPRPAWNDAKNLLGQSAYRRLLFSMVLIFSSFSAYDLCISLHLRDLGAEGALIGSFWAIATSTEVLMLFWAGKLLSRYGPGKLLTLACATSVVRWIFISQCGTLWLLVALQPLHAVSFGLMWASAIGVLKRETAGLGTATAQGLYASAIAVGGTLGLSTWGTVYETWGGTTVFQISALLMLGAALSASRLIRLSPAIHQEDLASQPSQ